MSPRENCAVFAHNNTPASVGEVVRAALFRNELQACVSEVSLKDACEAKADSGDLEADEDAVDAGIEQFRVENDLISAEETEAWLEKRGITADDLQEYFTRGYWRDTLGESVTCEEIGPSGLSPDLIGELEMELLMSGALGALAIGLSRRLVARASAGAQIGSAQLESERALFLGRTGLEPANVAGWLGSLDRGNEWLDGMLAMEASYRAMSGSALTPERLSRALGAMRLPLTRLELERVEFDSIDAAREGRLCVRDDNLQLEEVARESRFPFRRLEVWANDLPEDQRQKLLCAEIGEVQDPAFLEGVFNLSRVVRRTEPTLDNPAVRHAVEQSVLDSHFSEAGARTISWFIR
jgi:hypothetical protein